MPSLFCFLGYLEEVPEVHEVTGEHELLCFGNETVGHEAEILDQFGGAVHRHVHVMFSPGEQAEQQVVHLMQNDRRVGTQRKVTGWDVKRTRGAEHLTEGVTRDEGHQEIRRS